MVPDKFHEQVFKAPGAAMENTTAAASSFTTPWKLSVLELTGASAHHSCGSGAHLALLQLHGALDPNP